MFKGLESLQHSPGSIEGLDRAEFPSEISGVKKPLELPDDSGETHESLELPDDSGEDLSPFDLADDNGEMEKPMELPDDSGEELGPIDSMSSGYGEIQITRVRFGGFSRMAITSNEALPNNETDTEDSAEGDTEGETKELTEEEINELQREAIREAFDRIARGEKLTDAEKGNLGEMLMDQYYISQGYKPIHQPRVTDLEHKSGQGIDGVYEKTNSDGSKSYVIADAKVNHSKLNKGLADGTDQMSSAWIDKRLDNSVGKEKADEIREAYEDNPESVSAEVYHFSYGESSGGTSTSDISTVDASGNQSKEKTQVQSFDMHGNEIQGGELNDQG